MNGMCRSPHITFYSYYTLIGMNEDLPLNIVVFLLEYIHEDLKLLLTRNNECIKWYYQQRSMSK